jgi:transcriptional regulator with XRE-family HTH domain
MRKGPSSKDKDVGRRLRAFRLQRHMSQTSLGQQLGLTFQQVQKYENGTNRIGAGRLAEIAQILGVPVSAFFDNATPLAAAEKPLLELVDTAAALRLLQAYNRMKNPATRQAFARLAEKIADAGER